MNGIIIIDKPAGWTSHDVVAKVRGLLKSQAGHKIKVGHTGTLDPMATGLLILVVGSYTKRAGEFSKLDKMYEAELTLGSVSTTGDKEGQITKVSDKRPKQAEIEQVAQSFIGKIQQTPHAYSAIKIDGRRAYDIVRRGGEVQLEPRDVTIYEITDMKYDYPTIKFTVKVSSGTYIRSLAEDIGDALGTGAYLTSLHRTFVGKHSLQDALSIPDINSGKVKFYDA